MKPPKSKMSELAHNATGGEKSHAETAESAEFKMTELGPIPVDWEVKRLGDFCSKIGSGSTPTGGSAVYLSRGTSFIRSQNVYNGYFKRQGLAFISELAASSLDGVTVVEDDVLLNITGDSVARCTMVPTDVLPARVSQHVAIIRVARDRINPSYLQCYLTSPSMQTFMLNLAHGQGGSRNALTKGMVADFQIPLPSLPEQRKIAETLSDIDELISALGKLIEKKRNIKTGAMQELLGMRNEECGMRNVPRRRLAGFSGEWVEKRLGEIASFETATIGVDKMDSEWYIGTENMLAEKAGVEKNLTPVPYATVKEYKVGDVLISNIRPYLKKIWLADRDGGCSTDVLVVRTIDNRICTPMFLKMLLSDDSFFDFTMANAVGTKMPRGDKNVIVNYQVHLPTLTEQKAIAAVLSDMDAEIAALEADRAKYESIKQGMMQELLTGKTRLRGK